MSVFFLVFLKIESSAFMLTQVSPGETALESWKLLILIRKQTLSSDSLNCSFFLHIVWSVFKPQLQIGEGITMDEKGQREEKDSNCYLFQQFA